MLGELLQRYLEVIAEPVENIRIRFMATLIGDLGKGCPMDSRLSRDLIKRDAPILTEFLIRNEFLQSKPNHFILPLIQHPQ